MKLQRMMAIGIFAMVVLLLSGTSVLAHHSRAGIYEPNSKMITMKGTVSEWRWRNPHVFLVWDVKDESGKVVEWVGELSSITSMQSEGLNRGSFKGGEEITVSVAPARSGAPQGQLLKVVMADGKVPIDRTKGPIPD
jgi:Family of unknown function (DUF6152)